MKISDQELSPVVEIPTPTLTTEHIVAECMGATVSEGLFYSLPSTEIANMIYSWQLSPNIVGDHRKILREHPTSHHFHW